MNAAHAHHDTARLAYFPVSFFATVMGTAGLAIAWQQAHLILGAPALISQIIRDCATLIWVVTAAFYGVKFLRHRSAVKGEWRHPVRINFFPTISIGLLLLAMAWAEDRASLAAPLWGLGAGLHLAFTVAIMGGWLHHTHYETRHASPAWFIPVVGNIIVPVAGIRFAPPELSWFFFSIGVVFWLVLLTIVMYRLFFHEPLSARLTPTLFILLAPPSVGFVAWTSLTGEVDAFARILLHTALFLSLLLFSNALRFLRLPFFISAWAYSFPLAAVTIATLVMAGKTKSTFFSALGMILLSVLSLVLLLLVLRTLIALGRNEVCQPE
ncbi:MAG TPA: SLAC1 anion channel family protein [Azospira sp.]|nr:SLAC1 anion channel family protein [Azospira sp.]